MADGTGHLSRDNGDVAMISAPKQARTPALVFIQETGTREKDAATRHLVRRRAATKQNAADEAFIIGSPQGSSDSWSDDTTRVDSDVTSNASVSSSKRGKPSVESPLLRDSSHSRPHRASKPRSKRTSTRGDLQTVRLGPLKRAFAPKVRTGCMSCKCVYQFPAVEFEKSNHRDRAWLTNERTS